MDINYLFIIFIRKYVKNFISSVTISNMCIFLLSVFLYKSILFCIPVTHFMSKKWVSFQGFTEAYNESVEEFARLYASCFHSKGNIPSGFHLLFFL